MSKVRLPRLAAASRRFLDELVGHADQCRDPGYDLDKGQQAIFLAARDLNLALDGRTCPWDPLPEPDSHPGVKIRAYAGRAEMDVTEAIELQSGVIRSVMPELLYRVGFRDPRAGGQDVGPDYELNMKLQGWPVLLGVKLRDEDGGVAGGALKRAVERLEALMQRADVQEYLKLSEAAEAEVSAAKMPATGRDEVGNQAARASAPPKKKRGPREKPLTRGEKMAIRQHEDEPYTPIDNIARRHGMEPEHLKRVIERERGRKRRAAEGNRKPVKPE